MSKALEAAEDPGTAAQYLLAVLIGLAIPATELAALLRGTGWAP